MLRQDRCFEYDAMHGSQHGNHICSCKDRQGHGKVHICPHCKRRWGHPTFKVKTTSMVSK